jgi:hypothetical protein
MLDKTGEPAAAGGEVQKRIAIADFTGVTDGGTVEISGPAELARPGRCNGKE